MQAFARPPETVTVGGRSYPICTDFRAGVALETAVLSGEVDLAQLLRLYYPRGLPDDLDGAVNAMLWFYRCGAADNEDGTPRSHGTTVRAYDFEQDADAICAAFRAAYGIDLETARLHWWTFRRLLRGLPEDCAFMRRVTIRTADLSGMGAEQRRAMRKLKDQYALRPGGRRKTLAERNAAMLAYAAKRLDDAARKR